VSPASVPGASSHCTSPVTTYVPLSLPIGPAVAYVPPPVTALDVPSWPAGVTKVPEPVMVICELSSANAEAIPPALRIPVESDFFRKQ
jgi:hypothetical protein